MLRRQALNNVRTFAATTAPAVTQIPMNGRHAVPQNKKAEVPPFTYQELFQSHGDAPECDWVRLDEASKHVSTFRIPGEEIDRLRVGPEAIRLMTERANRDMAHLLRPSHLAQLSSILNDAEATDNDKFVALQLLKNSVVAAGFNLPSCQDTGTAIVSAKRGHLVHTDGNDEEHLSHGVYNIFTQTNLRYSQVAPISMYVEKNTRTNLPMQIDIYATKGDKYKFLFFQKGGGSANKTFLFQKTKSLLNPEGMQQFLRDTVKTLGTAACPPYHLALVIGGLSAEMNLKTVKMASARYLDDLPTSGNDLGRAFRDLELEKQVLEHTRDELKIGAQWGGKYFCHDVRVIRLPRHGASCPVGLGVSCSADRQIRTKITKDGVFVERLETDPARFLPEVDESKLAGLVVDIDMDQGMNEMLKKLHTLPVKTKVRLTGTLIVARDIAHARLEEMLKKTGKLPDYMKKYPVYYAGPAKTPEGLPSGSFGPTTASRMDPYIDKFQSNGASMVMLAKGNRSPSVTRACQKNGGFYLCSIGGPAALLASESIKDIKVLDMEELGMEAVWQIRVENFPAFVAVDDKGNDFFQHLV